MEWFFKKNNNLIESNNSLPGNISDLQSEESDEKNQQNHILISQKSEQETQTDNLNEKKKTINYKEWIPFNKFDSMQLEKSYQRMMRGSVVDKFVQVRNGLYEVDLASKICYAIYWKENFYSVIRYDEFFETTASKLKNKLSK